MSFIKRWFTRKQPEDYEQILSSLAIDISKRQTLLSEMRLRERRMTLFLTIYAFAAWGAYVALWYSGWLYIPGIGSGKGGSGFGGAKESGLQKFFKGVPIVVGPILIQFTRRIVQLWYTRKENAEESHLKSLLAKQRATVEDIKKKTNYYSTKNLIERYDDNSSSGATSAVSSPLRTPVRRGPGGAGQGRGGQPQPPNTITPMRPVPGQFSQQRQNANGRQLPAQQNSQQQQQDSNNPFLTTASTPLPPPKKQWYDKVADALLGDDERAAEAREKMNRYALICRRCYAHNGLVREGEMDSVQYACPKCGFFNASLRALKEESSQSQNQKPQSSADALHLAGDLPTPVSPTSPSPLPTQRPSSSIGNVQARRQPQGKTERRKSGLSKSIQLDDEDQNSDEAQVEGDRNNDFEEVGENTVLMEVDG